MGSTKETEIPNNRQLIADFASGNTRVSTHIQQRLQRIEALNPKINALVTPNPEALAQAQALERMRENHATLPPPLFARFRRQRSHVLSLHGNKIGATNQVLRVLVSYQ